MKTLLNTLRSVSSPSRQRTRVLTGFVWLLAGCSLAAAQVHNFQFPRMGGSYYASSFANWKASTVTPITAPGLATFQVSPSAITLVANDQIQPAAAGVPLLILGSPSEVVTPVSVNCGAQLCSVTATFTYAHPGGFTFTSASGGLDEAIGTAAAQGGGTVIVGSDWSGSTAQIIAAAGNPAVSVLDSRTGASIRYAWTGSAYQHALDVTAGGAVQAQSIETVLYADQFAKCDGVSDDSAGLQAWLNAVVAAHTIGFIPAKTCTFATPLVIGNGATANSNWGIEGVGAASRLKYTGTTVAPALEVNGAATQIGDNFNLLLRDFVIQGNASSTNDLACISCHYSTLANLHLDDTSGYALYMAFGEGNSIRNITTSQYDQPSGVWEIQRPAGCMEFDQIGTGDVNTLNTSAVIAADCQNVSSVGIYLKAAKTLAIVSPEIQAPINIQIDQGSAFNTVTNATMETAASFDVVDNGFEDNFTNDIITKGIQFGATSRSGTLDGGEVGAITIAAGALNTAIVGSALDAASISDGGGNTQLGYSMPVQTSGGGALPTQRFSIPALTTVSGYASDPQDALRGSWTITTAGAILSNTVLNGTGGHWRLLLMGIWTNDADSGNLAQPGSIVEVSEVSPTVAIGSEVVTFSVNAAKQLQAAVTTGSGNVYFEGSVFFEHAFGASNQQGPGLRLAGAAYLGGGATLPSGQTFTATGATWSGGTVNATTLEQGSAAVALASQLPLSGSVAGSTTSIAANACSDAVTTTVTGATAGMVAAASGEGALPSAGLILQASVTATNTVTVEYCNITTAAIVPAALTIAVRVIQ